MILQESFGTFFPGIMSGATTTKVYNWPSNRNAGYDGAMELVCMVHPFMILSCWQNTIPKRNECEDTIKH